MDSAVERKNHRSWSERPMSDLSGTTGAIQDRHERGPGRGHARALDEIAQLHALAAIPLDALWG